MFNEDYTHVTLVSSSIPNSFTTIQEDTNDSFIIGGIFVAYDDTFKIKNKINLNIIIKIPQGSYTQNSLISTINNELKKIYYKDIGSNFIEEKIKDEKLWYNDNFFKINEKNNRLEFNINEMYFNYYFQKVPDLIDYYQSKYYFESLTIKSDNLSYKWLGLKKNNEYPLIINSYYWTSYSSTEFQKVAFTDYSAIQYNIYIYLVDLV